MLQKFQFEDEADRIQAEVGTGVFEDGRAADVGPDDFFDRGDLFAIDHFDLGGTTTAAPSWGAEVLRPYELRYYN